MHCNIAMWIVLYIAIFCHVQHPSYDVGSGFTPNDFAVVSLTSTPSGSNISPGSIPSGANNPGGNGAITGWGRTCGQ
jgi:hypothetical protein